MRLLLDAGAEVEHQNENGHTPLMEAASCGHVGEIFVPVLQLLHMHLYMLLVLLYVYTCL